MTDISNRYHEIIAPVIAYDTEIDIVEGSGSWVTDADGQRYLDFACGIAVLNLGHVHPEVPPACQRRSSWSRAAASTASRLLSLTRGEPAMTSETSDFDTPAFSATSTMVGCFTHPSFRPR